MSVALDWMLTMINTRRPNSVLVSGPLGELSEITRGAKERNLQPLRSYNLIGHLFGGSRR